MAESSSQSGMKAYFQGLASPSEDGRILARTASAKLIKNRVKVDKVTDYPSVNSGEAYVKLRNFLRRKNNSTSRTHLQSLYDQLSEAGFVVGSMADGHLTTGFKPFNVFARVGMGLMKQKEDATNGWLGTEVENDKLGEYKHRFVVACNRAENDVNWEDGTPEWVGKASMSKRHRFLLVKSVDWWTYNAAGK